MAEADRPGKLFIGNLNTETNEKAIESYFGKFGRISEVLLIRDRETNKSKGYAFVTYDNPSDAKDASRELHGKSFDGKPLKVEQATKPRFESAARRGYSMHPRSRGSPRSSRGSSGMRGPPGRGISPRGPPSKRGPPMRNGGPPPKRSALSGPMGRSSMYRDRDPYGPPPRRDTMSRRDDYPSPRDDHYSMKDSYSSQDYMSSRDSRDYGPSPRDYSYRDYPSSSRDDYDSISRGYGDRDGYGGGREHRGYMDRPSGGSYRDLYDDEEDEDDDDDYGNSRSAPHSRGHPPSYGRSGGGSRYDDYGSSSRDGYGSRDGYSSSRSVPYSASRNDRPPRQDLERGYPPRQYSSSSRGAPRGRGGHRTDRGMNRSRY